MIFTHPTSRPISRPLILILYRLLTDYSFITHSFIDFFQPSVLVLPPSIPTSSAHNVYRPGRALKECHLIPVFVPRSILIHKAFLPSLPAPVRRILRHKVPSFMLAIGRYTSLVTNSRRTLRTISINAFHRPLPATLRPPHNIYCGMVAR